MSSDNNGLSFLFALALVFFLAFIFSFIFISIVKAILIFMYDLFVFFGHLLLQHPIISILSILLTSELLHALLKHIEKNYTDPEERNSYRSIVNDVSRYICYVLLFSPLFLFSMYDYLNQNEHLKIHLPFFFGLVFFDIFTVFFSFGLHVIYREKVDREHDLKEAKKKEAKKKEEQEFQKRKKEEAYQLEMEKLQVFIDTGNLLAAKKLLQDISESYPEHNYDIHQKIRDIEERITEEFRDNLRSKRESS